MLYDTGGNPASSSALDLVVQLNLAGGFSISASAPVNMDINAILNTHSPFSGSFSGIDPMRMGWMNYLDNVPPANALYLAPGSALPPVGSTTPLNNVTGVFVPTAQSFGGTGACLLGFPDGSMFEMRNYTGVYNGIGPPNTSGIMNQYKLAPAWLGAVSPTGACGIPAISKAFAPTAVVSGGMAGLTISITNPTGAPVSSLKVTDALPAPLVVGGAASTTCTGGTLAAAIGSNSVSLTGATLPAGGCTITVPVQWPASSAALCMGTGTTVTNTITPGSDFTTSLGQVNTPATATLSCPMGAPLPVAVPTLSQWALATLALLMAWLAWSQRLPRGRRRS